MKGNMRISLNTGQYFFRLVYNLQQKEKTRSDILELLANKIYIYIYIYIEREREREREGIL